MQEPIVNAKNTTQVPHMISLGKPKSYKPSFNPSTTPSFNPPPNPSSAMSTEKSSFNLDDFLFIPKLLSLGKDVHTMASQGLSSNDVGRQVRDRFTAIYDHPNIALNVNVHVKNPAFKQQNCNVAPVKTYQFLVNVGNAQVKEKFTPHLDNNIETHLLSKDKSTQVSANAPGPIKSFDLDDRTQCNFKSNNFDNFTLQTIKSPRIRKRKNCHCKKRRSLDDLIREERSFNKQIEKVKYFWKGANSNHPFMFKKKLIDFYTESEEPIMSEVVDFSKKAINAEDMHMSVSDK